MYSETFIIDYRSVCDDYLPFYSVSKIMGTRGLFLFFKFFKSKNHHDFVSSAPQ